MTEHTASQQPASTPATKPADPKPEYNPANGRYEIPPTPEMVAAQKLADDEAAVKADEAKLKADQAKVAADQKAAHQGSGASHANATHGGR